jgi:hypothetical protein
VLGVHEHKNRVRHMFMNIKIGKAVKERGWGPAILSKSRPPVT